MYQKIHLEKVEGTTKNPDPVGHSEAPWWQFWILQAVRVPPLPLGWYYMNILGWAGVEMGDYGFFSEISYVD